MLEALQENRPDAVMHFAAYKNAGESVQKPKEYYQNNFIGAKTLLDCMLETGVISFILSSTCAIYGNPKVLPVAEKTPANPISPYGKSKLMIETLLTDYQVAYGLNSVSLRYFNAAGASETCAIGEQSESTANIIPLIIENLLGHKSGFQLYGNKFNTDDGTQERDYIHVSDLATGHLKALEYVSINKGAHMFNLGTGTPTSNMELIKLAEKLAGKNLEYKVIAPRQGDPEKVYADPSFAKRELHWKAKYDIEDIMKSSWDWHSKSIASFA